MCFIQRRKRVLRSKFSQPDWLDDQFYLKMIFDWFLFHSFSLLISLALSFSSTYFYRVPLIVHVSKLTASKGPFASISLFTIISKYTISDSMEQYTLKGFVFLLLFKLIDAKQDEHNIIYTIEIDVGTNKFAFSLFTGKKNRPRSNLLQASYGNMSITHIYSKHFV